MATHDIFLSKASPAKYKNRHNRKRAVVDDVSFLGLVQSAFDRGQQSKESHFTQTQKHHFLGLQLYNDDAFWNVVL